MHTPHPRFTEADFLKSSFSNPNQDCVEFARVGNWVALRDSKIEFGSPSDRHLIISGAAFRAFASTLPPGREGDD